MRTTAITLGLLLSLASFNANANSSTQAWTTNFGTPARTSYVANVEVDVSSIKNIWSIDGGSFSNIVADDQSVYAIDYNNPNGGAVLMKLNTANGSIVWQQSIYVNNGAQIALGANAIYFLSGDTPKSVLYAYNTNDGKIIFSHLVSDQAINYAPYSQSPAVDNNHVYVASFSYINSINANTGESEWQSPRLPSFNQNVTVTNNNILRTADSETYVLDKLTGKESDEGSLRYERDTKTADKDFVPAWDAKTNTTITYFPPADDESVITYVAFAMNSHTTNFATRLSKSLFAQTVLTPTNFYVSSPDTVSSYSMQSGSSVWQWPAPSNRISHLLATDNVLFASDSFAGKTYAIDLLSGKSVWQTNVGGELALAGNTLYITSNHKISAFQFNGVLRN